MADHIPLLFKPVKFRSVEARNRIVVSPMCQYSADNGLGNDWHIQNLGARAAGGAGIVFTEATHVSAAGRITPHCLGLWNDEQETFMTRLAAVIARSGAVPAIQIAHAGRKASTTAPWIQGSGFLTPDEPEGWLPVAPSAVAFSPERPAPHELSVSHIQGIIADFAATAARARRAGFKIAELHGAHGYLIHEFLSPISNLRTDQYGGDLTGRTRMLNETIKAVRAVWGDDLPLFVRLSCTDWMEGGLTGDDAVQICKMLAERGDVDLIDASTGGIAPAQKIPSIHPGYQVPFAERIRNEAGIPTGAVGMIREADHAAEIIANRRADLVFLARAMIADPHWPLRAAQRLGVKLDWPPQYLRGEGAF
jgi:2,4-dienoyl-CoA reductase-like NADH-dependent reductase (Old Yellow Enzyme family)